MDIKPFHEIITQLKVSSYMSVKEWFINRYRDMGSTLTGDETTPQSIRVNPLKTSDTELIQTLTEQGVQLEKIPYLDHGYKVLSSPFSLGANLEYLFGFYSLQETASQYPVQTLSPTSLDKLLDMASAPGGKTTQAATYMNNQGVIMALDISRKRLFATENNLERCGVTNTSIHHIDALNLPDRPAFTKILLDAPCSGNFVTDPYWFSKRTTQDIARNADLQKKLLSKAINLLESGGTLVYATCSLEPEENEFNIQWLLENHQVKLIELGKAGSPAVTDIGDIKLDSQISYCRRFWPDKTGTQGFFVAQVMKP